MTGECVMHFLPLANFVFAFNMLYRFLNVIFRIRLSQEYKPKMLKGVILQYFRVVFLRWADGLSDWNSFYKKMFYGKKRKKSFNEESEGNFVDLWSCKIWAKRRLRLDSGLTYNYENETWEITLPTRFYCKIWSSALESFTFWWKKNGIDFCWFLQKSTFTRVSVN